MTKLAKSEQLEIKFPDSAWTLKIQTRGNIIGLGLHWADKESPTHFKALSGKDASQLREFLNAKNNKTGSPSRNVPNEG